MQPPPDYLLEPQYFYPLFALMWVGIVAVLSVLGGWARLSSRYPSRSNETGQRFRFASMALGASLFPVNYSHCLTVQVGSSGIGIRPFILFRLFHAPLFIPWSAVAECKRKKRIFGMYTAVYLADPANRLLFGGRLGEVIQGQFDEFHN